MEDVKVVAPKSDELLQLLQAKEKGRSESRLSIPADDSQATAVVEPKKLGKMP